MKFGTFTFDFSHNHSVCVNYLYSSVNRFEKEKSCFFVEHTLKIGLIEFMVPHQFKVA